MTTNYIKSVEYEKRFRNRDQKDVLVDDDYVKFKEEEDNTKKMSTILKNLNSPKRKTINFLKGHSRQLNPISKSTKSGVSASIQVKSFTKSFYNE